MERSASCIVMYVGFIATFPILFSGDNDIRLMLDLRSRNALPIDRFPIDIGMVKLLGSPSFFLQDGIAILFKSHYAIIFQSFFLSYELF